MATDSHIDPDEPRGLAAFGTVRWAIGFVFHNFGSLLKISITPFILSVVLTNAQKMIELFSILDMKGWGDPLFNVLILAAVAPQATAWHRFALLPDQKLYWCQFVFGMRELRFLLISLAAYVLGVAVGLATAAAMAPVPDFGVAVQILFVLLLMWILARCVMFLPAASVGAREGFVELLRMTRGIAGRIVGVYLVCAVLMTIFGLGFSALSDIAVALTVGLPGLVTVIAETLPRAFFNLLAIGVFISVLSSIYKQISMSARGGSAASTDETDETGEGGSP